MSGKFYGLICKIIFVLAHLHTKALSVPDQLVQNGGFDSELFLQPENESEWSIGKSKIKLPNWRISNGNIQLLSSKYFYATPPSWSNIGNYCVHLNGAEGPATILSAPLLGQIAGAIYNLSIDVAGTPLGGELYKKLQITIIFHRKIPFWLFDEYTLPQYEASNPYNSRTIPWTTTKYAFLGTGRKTLIKIASKSEGSKGFLIDNVRVSLHNILDNGSFEQLIQDNTTTTFPDIVNSPSWRIKNWYLESGSIKYIRGRIQPSTDLSGTAIDLNGDGPGLLTRNVSTINNELYYISFDYAANPEAEIVFKGYFSLTVLTQAVNDENSTLPSTIKQKLIKVTSKGRSNSAVGWQTCKVGFYAKSDFTTIRFQSSVNGTFGPLLDSVQMYQYYKSFPGSS
ncbi:hypothetical protein R1sor_000447 [Riccia sorocarpa]|uniref:DUF642 domain-containing protein n=1 Tax=Riccia sorocarpa TaxID=122646 RepID=A0ABD3GT49_9MARC